jgi:cytosine/uracil/thiamine/allantoin permease
VDLAGFGILWVLQITFWKEETEEKSKLEACPNLPTLAQSIFMVDNALGTSVSGPLPEGIEERCPKSWPWTKFCHESVYY